MKDIKKILVTALSTVAICCFALVGVNAAHVYAANVVNENEYFVQGGAVKIKDERGAGVKFHVAMTEDYFKTYGTIGADGKGILNSGVTTGTLLLPYCLTEGKKLTVDGTYKATVSNSDTTNVWFKDGDYMQSVVYLYNIPETDYGTEISVRGYIKNGDNYTYTTQEDGISMSFVAQAEYNDTNSALTAEEKQSLKSTYLEKTISYCVEGKTTSETVNYLGLTSECPVPAAELADGSKFVGWATKDGTIVKNVSSSRVKNSMDLYATYRQKVLMTDENAALSFTNYAGYTVESAKIGSYDLTVSGNDITIPAKLKDDTVKHGEQTVTITFAKDNTKFTANLPVLLITKEISSLSDFLSSCRYYGTDIYGYYVLTKNISYDEGFGSMATAATRAWRANKKGFKGTFDGQGYSITWYKNYLHGVFGVLYGATVKNVTLAQSCYNADWGATLVAFSAYYTTFENVNITVAGDAQTSINNAPVLEEMAGCQWKDCDISTVNTVGVLIRYAKKDDVVSTYENVTVTKNATKFSNDIEAFDLIQQITNEEITLSGRQDFVLDGEADLLDLGIYNGLEILNVKTSNGEVLDGISTATARRILTDKQKHGEQNIIVTVVKADGNKLEITVPVTVITKVITTMSDLQATVKHFTGADDIYGYYILGNDITCSEEGFTAKQGSNGWDQAKAFKGTLDGRRHTIVMQSGGKKGAAFGLFGTLNGATIKNVTIKDIYSGQGWGVAVLSYNAYNTTFDNLTINIVDGKKNTGAAGYTPFVSNTMNKCVWKNSSIISSVDIENVFASQSNNEFSGGLDVIANVTGGFSTTVTLDNLPAGVTVKKN